MANGNSRKNKTKPKNTKRRRNFARPRGGVSDRRSYSATGIGSLLHKGVRSVLTCLPGSNITTRVADVIFRGLGWSNTLTIDSKTKAVKAEVRWLGLSTWFYLTAEMLLGNAIGAVSTLKRSTPNGELMDVYTNYSTFRLVSFKISARNVGSATVHGTWAIGFWPFNSENDISAVKDGLDEASLADIRQAPYYVDGPAKQSLTLRHYFNLANWYARTPGAYDRKLGVIAICYYEPNRQSFADFTPDDFDPVIDISGSVVMSSRRPETSVNFVNQVTSDSTIASIIRDGKQTVMVKREGYVCEHKGGKDYCVVTGYAQQVVKHPNNRVSESFEYLSL